MATPRQSESETQHLVPTIQPFNLLDMPANISPVVELKDLHPPLYQAMQLWNIFVQNVDPVNKFLHIPTAQIDVFTAMNNENCAQPDMHCFLFSVFFAATTALSPNDVTHLLGQDKKTALMRFKHGLEQSLAQANILETPSLKALQAIGLFLVCCDRLSTRVKVTDHLFFRQSIARTIRVDPPGFYPALRYGLLNLLGYIAMVQTLNCRHLKLKYVGAFGGTLSATTVVRVRTTALQ